MLPVSGAEQLIASLPMMERPTTSASGAYSRLVSPAPQVAVGHEQVPQAQLAGARLQVAHDLRLLVRVRVRGDLRVVHRPRPDRRARP